MCYEGGCVMREGVLCGRVCYVGGCVMRVCYEGGCLW